MAVGCGGGDGNGPSGLDVSDNGNRLVGTFTADDCFAIYSGGFTYTRQ